MTKYSKSTRESVFNLYAMGEPAERICKQVKVSKDTFYRWKKEDNWVKRRGQINEKALKVADETLTDIKKRQHAILKGVMSRFAEQLKNKEIDVKPSDIVHILRHELHLFGEADLTIEDKNVTEMIEWMKKIAPRYQEK